MASRLSGQLRKFGFRVFLAVGRLGYPFEEYQIRWSVDERGYNVSNEEALEQMNLSPTDSPWTQERHAQAAQWGELIFAPDPGWGNQHDTFCMAIDEIGGRWERLALACGDTIFSEPLMDDVMGKLPWPCQFQMHPCHSIFLLDKMRIGVYRDYADKYRRRPERYLSWKEVIRRYPDGDLGTGVLKRSGIRHCGWHDWPWQNVKDTNALWYDVDSPSKYAIAKDKIQKGEI
jgi:hypothetical protein